jgi:hypothetical protein
MEQGPAAPSHGAVAATPLGGQGAPSHAQKQVDLLADAEERVDLLAGCLEDEDEERVDLLAMGGEEEGPSPWQQVQPPVQTTVAARIAAGAFGEPPLIIRINGP